ncbi:MAG: hypothetical protein P8Y45_06695 [Exilibacterium sp.]
MLAGLSYRETSFKGFSSDPELGAFRQTFSRLWVAPGADRNFTARVQYRL